MLRKSPVLPCLILSLAFGACGKKNNESPPSTVPNNPPVGVVDDSAGFYARVVQVANVNFPIHAGSTTPTTACTALQGQQVDCYVEGEELDLFYQGLTLQFNVPSTMCAYTQFMPYYYYLWQPGTGPTTVQIDTDQNGVVGIDSNNDGTIDTVGANTTCQYDYTASKGPNCCTGNYVLVQRTWNSTSTPAGYTTNVTANNSWGGDRSACIAGPAVDTQPKDKLNFPEATVTFSYNAGSNFSYTIASPISKGKRENIYIANYFDLADNGGAAPPPIVAQAYDLQCLDRSFELQAQIRVWVRDWNTEAAFNNLNTVPTGFDITGSEPAPFGAFPLNDFKDWKDYGALYPQGDD